MSDISLKLFTVGELRDWLYHNSHIDGLSDVVIARQRAYAIVNNPYVNDEMAVVSALYVDAELTAYTAAFPEVLQRPLGTIVWWFTTLSCKKQYEGRGYGLAVVGNLCDSIKEGVFLDIDGAIETVNIFRFLGLNCSFVDKFLLSDRYINIETFKGKCAYLIQSFEKNINRFYARKLKSELSESIYSIRYISFVDDETYKFIAENSSADLMLRSQQTLNWILSFPFMKESPITKRTPRDCEFSSTVNKYDVKAVQVVKDKTIVGFYILRNSSENLSVKYLYFLEEYKKIVFLSIAEHFFNFKAKRIVTLNRELASFLMSYHLCPNMYIEKQSFSYPDNFEFSTNLRIQGGDGDTFV